MKPSSTNRENGYANVNGLRMYFETHGLGEPLILLHGGFGSTAMFDPIKDILAKDRRLIAVDLQGHGRTADIDRPLRYELMADDVAELIKQLDPGRADVMGYSLGGGVALRTAIQHPDLVERLIVVSTTFRRDGWYPEVLAAMIDRSPEAMNMLKHSPMYESYSKIAPRPQDFSVLMDKLAILLRQDYDWSSEVSRIKVPTLLVFGDADSVRTSHAVQFFELLGGGQMDAGWDGSKMSNARLAILPAATHYNIFSSPLLANTVVDFLEKM